MKTKYIVIHYDCNASLTKFFLFRIINMLTINRPTSERMYCENKQELAMAIKIAVSGQRIPQDKARLW